MQRKLTVILSADVTGYSRMMERDEEATHQATSGSIELFRERMAGQGGRVFSVAGDGLMAEFPSVVNAVKFAADIQNEIAAANAHRPQETRIEFRIGIHLGDAIIQDNNIFGDCVNVAARLQQLPAAGGICISQAVFEQVRNKVSFGYESMGQQQLKNIAEPVDAYLVRTDQKSAVLAPSVRKTWEPLTLPGRPSIAVLPFNDFSEDAGQTYFSDGITEDIITSLSRFRELFVIARNSSFVYKGRSMRAQQIGRELGVRYLLEGSVRRAGQRIRVTAQLIDAADGHHLWSDQYDRMLADLFATQDEITQVIVATLAGQLEVAERARARQTETQDLEAYGFLLRGQEAFHQYTRQTNAQAREMYEKAIQRDRNYARAHSALSRTFTYDWRYMWTENPVETFDKALELARRATALDDTDARGHCELGFVYLFKKEFELAIGEFERAHHLNPNDADVMAELGDAHAYNGEAEKGAELIRRAMRLNPFYPDWYLWYLGDAYYALRRYEDVIGTLQKMHNLTEGRRLLAASYAQLGKIEEARTQAREVLAAHPQFSIARWAAIQPERNPAELEHFIEGLRKAGLPD